MNFKRQAEKLESFLHDEFKQKLPIALLPNGNLVYNSFTVKKNKKEQWCLYRNSGGLLDTFNLKASCLIAAKLYNASAFSTYNELKMLDNLYHKNNTDYVIFKHRYSTTTDNELKDLFIARSEIAQSKSIYAKQQIADKFKALFDK
jgi:hypothetical protein